MRSRTSRSDKEWPVFPIGPILESYGGDHVMEGYAWRPYRCPFHDDSSASASVNEMTNIFKCHGCDISGDAITVIKKYEKIGWADAIKRAEEIAGASGGGVRAKPDPRRGVSSRAANRSGSRAFRRPGRSG